MTHPEFETQDTEAATLTSKSQRDGVIQIALVAGVLLAGFAANAILSNSGSQPQIRVTGATVMPVETVMPEIGDAQVRIFETGTVQVRNAIDLSPQVSGRVVMVNPVLVSGGSFKKGEVLFRLDSSDYRANLDRAQADLAAKQADLKVEQSEADIAIREWQLVRPGEPVPATVAREPHLERARAAVRSSEAALADAQFDLNRVTYSLPFDGRILSTTIEVGQNLLSGQSYGQAYDPSGIEVSVPVNAAIAQSLSPATGRDAIVRSRQVTPFQTESAYAATVTRVDAELDQQTRLARLIVEFNDEVSLLPGDFVDVEITGPVIPDAYTFPERAIQENRIVWVVEGDVIRQRQPVLITAENGEITTTPFDTSDGIVVTMMSDPKDGDEILLSDRPSTDGGRP